MKTIRQLVTLGIIIFIASACATSSTIPEKYNLDNQLENVSNISISKLMRWDRVDNQCFTLQTSPTDYYLIVLEDMTNTLSFANTVQLSKIDTSFWRAYSDVILNDDGWEESYAISKIYKFRDHEQVREIRAQLSGQINLP
jgi:hypothetical protein